jgi:hypothetical protein
LGYTTEQIIGSNVYFISVPYRLPRVQCTMGGMMNEGQKEVKMEGVGGGEK